MKTLLLVSLLAQAGVPAPPPTMRGDAHLVVGWQNLRAEQPGSPSNDWLNRIFFGGAGAGWYWTDNLKTQIDAGGGTREHQYRFNQVTIDGHQAFETSRVAIRESNVSLSQQYQFFRNQWFHPHVGGGVELARETSTAEYQPTLVVDDVTHTTRTVLPARTDPAEQRWLARPFGEVGFKAYMTRRAFFTGDMRVMFRNGIDEVLFRTGFGFDF